MSPIQHTTINIDEIVDEIRKAPYQFIGQKATPRNTFRIVEIYKKMFDQIGLDYSCIVTQYDYATGMLHVIPIAHKNDPFIKHFEPELEYITVNIVFEGDRIWKRILKVLISPLTNSLAKLKRSKKK